MSYCEVVQGECPYAGIIDSAIGAARIGSINAPRRKQDLLAKAAEHMGDIKQEAQLDCGEDKCGVIAIVIRTTLEDMVFDKLHPDPSRGRE